MELQQDIVDLTINNDDDCLFPTELGEIMGNKENAKQNDVKQEKK